MRKLVVSKEHLDSIDLVISRDLLALDVGLAVGFVLAISTVRWPCDCSAFNQSQILCAGTRQL